MNTLTWVLLGLVVYSFAVLLLKSRNLLPSAVRIQGPLTTIHTKRGRALLEKLAAPKRFWRAWSNVGLGVALVVMVGSFLLLVQAALTTLQDPQPSAVNRPRNFLVIPGVNEFLPLSVAPEIVFGLLLGLIVHEGGHGLLCRVEDIDIKSMGVVLLTVIPIGAFVEPDEESQRRADRGGRSRMFAAGVTNNFVLAFVTFALLFGPVTGAIGVAPGVAVAGAIQGSPAADAGIAGGDRITAVAGEPVSDIGELRAVLGNTSESSVAVEIDGERTVTVDRHLIVRGTIGGNPANLSANGGGDPVRVTAVNGTPVNTLAGFQDAVEGKRFVELSTSEGTRVFPTGAYISDVVEDGPLGDTDAPSDGGFLVTAVDGTQVSSTEELQALLDETEPGERVTVEAYVDGEFTEWTVTLGENPNDGNGYLGVFLFQGTSGVYLTDFGIEPYPAGEYLSLVGGDGTDLTGMAGGLADSYVGLVYLALVLPLASVFGLPYNFPGFTANVQNFFVPQGPLAVLGGGVFVLANVLFWTAWINLQIGLFNCIPGYPLDGGRILRAGVEAIVSRLPISNPYLAVRVVTTFVGVTMLASLLVIAFAPRLLT